MAIDHPASLNSILAKCPKWLKPFAFIEWFAGHFYYWFSVSKGFRFLLEAGAALAVIAAIAGLWMQVTTTKEERIARMWDIATNPRPGNTGKVPALEFLNDRREVLVGLKIPSAFLHGVELRRSGLVGANLSAATLSESDLRGSVLHGTNLSNANLADADLRFTEAWNVNARSSYAVRTDFSKSNWSATDFTNATLIKAKFQSTDLQFAKFIDSDLAGADLGDADLLWTMLSDANMKNATGLTQAQLDQACARRDHPPVNLPIDAVTNKQLVWQGKDCE